MQNPVIIFGANHLGRLAKEIFEQNDVVVYGFLDDNNALHNQEIDDIVVLSSTDDEELLKLIGKKCEVFLALDDTRLKKSQVNLLNGLHKAQPVNAIHRGASVSLKCTIGHGNFIDNRVILAPGASLGSYNVINAGSIVGVKAFIGNYVQLGTGANIGSDVVIEDEVFIGAGATVVSGITIGRGARVGAGSVVVASVSAGDTVFGNPAQKIKP